MRQFRSWKYSRLQSLIFALFTFLEASCLPPTQQDKAAENSNSDGENNNGGETYKPGPTNPIPQIRTVGDTDRLNNKQPIVITYDKDFVRPFIGQRTPSYRVLWLNRDTTSGSEISVTQPLPSPLTIGTANSIDFYEIFAVGHNIKSIPKNGPVPDMPSLMIAVSPFYDYNSEFILEQDLIKKPVDYKLIYEFIHNDNLTFLKCVEKLDSSDPNKQAELKPEELEQCIAILPSYEAGSTLAKHIQRTSVAIWRPVCPDNYGSLGDVVTNGRVAKPYSIIDYKQFDNANETFYYTKFATYCVHLQFLEEAELGERIESTTATQTAFSFYRIRPKSSDQDANSTTGEDTNFFHTVEGLNRETNDQNSGLWVLKKSSIKIIN